MSATYSEPDLSACLEKLDIRQGDCLFIHSSLKGVGKLVTTNQRGTLQAILDQLLNAVGDSGTLVVPTFNFGFCEGKPFDRQNTPSEGMGAFCEFVRMHPFATRSRHPFQCVSAIGKNSARIGEAQSRSAFSAGGAFDTMLTLDCKIMFLGVEFVETFVHVSEERANVPYRFWKTFRGTYIDEGEARAIAVDFFARKIDLVPEPLLDKPKINQFIRGEGVVTTSPLGAGSASICRASNLVDTLTLAMTVDPSRFLLSAQDVG